MSEEKKAPNTQKKIQAEKMPAAVTLGHLGGVKGGPARAKKLSAQVRSRMARDAAIARWQGRRKKS